MTWQGIEGHDDVVERFRRSLSRGRLASTFLFVGPAGVGKRAFAEKLAQALLCQQAPAEQLAPCGHCTACVQVTARTHPDLILIEKPADKSTLPISLFVGEPERRMREGLCHDIALKPFMGGRKVAIIDDADDLNEESANCLLKTLEEPPPKSVLILIGTSLDKQLPTIRSRCQTVRFRPLEESVVASLLLARQLASTPDEAERLARFSEGSLQRAMELADEELWSFRQQLLRTLAAGKADSVTLAQQVAAFVDGAGKEAPPRRARLRLLAAFVLEFHRQWLRAAVGLTPQGDDVLGGAVQQAAARDAADAPALAALADRTLVALAQIDRNAHLPTLIDCWIDDLARIEQTGQSLPAYAE
jgi:DNA polymerase-3 subunit delta'